MPELPLELCQAIADEVDSQSDLFRLLQVSINFNAAAERQLYRTISLSGKQPRFDIAMKKLSVFKRIRTCPRVAAYVVHLTIELHSWSLPSWYGPQCFVKVFRSIPNLKTLRIYPSSEIMHSFQAHVPFLLRTFCYSGNQLGDRAFRPILENFLEGQVELEELLFTDTFTITLTPTALPKLTTVLGGGKFVRRLLLGRPVTRITILYDDEACPVIAGPLRSLCIRSTTDLKWYTSLFRTITFLQCRVWDPKDKGLTSYLGCLSRLKKIMVILDSGYLIWTDEEQTAFISRSFDGCPSLLYIELYDLCEAQLSGDGNQSMTWTRGLQTNTTSLWDPDEWRKI